MTLSVAVSFCVFGSDPDSIYYGGALRNAEMYLEWQPDWLLRFYIGATPVHHGLDRALAEYPNVDIVRVLDEPENQTSTFWRFHTLRLKNKFDVMMFRDTDSRPIPREKAAVEQWLDSGKLFHVMRDHPRHGATILAGLWGVREKGIHKIQDIPDRLEDDSYQVEQTWLHHNVWPHARRNLLAHNEAVWNFGTLTVPYAVPRSGLGFVGEGLFADDTPRYPEHRLELATRTENVRGMAFVRS